MGGLHRAVPRAPGTGVPGRDTVGSHVRDQVLRWSVQLAGHRPRVVFADGDDPRVVAAAGWLAENTSVRPTLLTGGPDGAVDDAGNGVDRWSMARLAGDPEVRDALLLRANGVRRDPAQADALAEDPVYASAALVACGRADAAVAGATRPRRPSAPASP